MIDLSHIFSGNKAWVDRKLATDPDYFRNLSLGQYPEVFYIGCSDSRVTAEDLMGVNPGEVFVYRNIANMIPNSDLSAQSVVSFAVTYLQVMVWPRIKMDKKFDFKTYFYVHEEIISKKKS